MRHRPTRLMLERLQTFGPDSDTALLHELLYLGEFLLKLTTATFIASLDDDNHHHRYRLMHGLVRADGLGAWVEALNDILTGPAAQHLSHKFNGPRNQVTALLKAGTWQHTAVSDLRTSINILDQNGSSNANRLSLRHWFQGFVELRNRTRGHGAPTPATCAKLTPTLQKSIVAICHHLPILDLPWVYLHRNLSGKYQVIPLSESGDDFQALTSSAAIEGPHYPDGVYIWLDGPRQIELMTTDLDVRDFYFPNGNFRGETYEIHSLLSDSRIRGDARPYMAPVGVRPPSESEGKSQLEHIGNVLTNIPNPPVGYVRRPNLEEEVRKALMNDRHPIVTLSGRGGIGKTSLVLQLLHELSNENRYDLIFWFSARDIDLTTSGPKLVRPHLLTERDLEREYRFLIGEDQDARGNEKQERDLLSAAMRSQPFGCALYVFDNFETVHNPIDLYHWIDTNIRLPNKVVITTRFRDFHADLPISVSGMERAEAELLVHQSARLLGIESLLRSEHVDAIFEQSDGHPYIIKILLGEMADSKSIRKPEKIIARKDNILDALFERTYQNLSPVAVRILLALCRWRSLVPELAAIAMLLRQDHGGENVDPEAAIDQLIRMSFVERISGADGEEFLRVPLSASLFCKRKLDVSPDHALIEEDYRFLYDFGATAVNARNPDFFGRISSFFKKTARKIGENGLDIEAVRPIAEFLASNYPRGWLLMSTLEEEASGPVRAAECIRRYLESEPDALDAANAWKRLVVMYQRSGDTLAACTAFLRAAEFDAPTLEEVSRMANLANGAADVRERMDTQQRRTVLVPLARLMEAFGDLASATDLSRLAWLYLNCGETGHALEITHTALEKEPNNIHCIRLQARLTEK